MLLLCDAQESILLLCDDANVGFALKMLSV